VDLKPDAFKRSQNLPWLIILLALAVACTSTQIQEVPSPSALTVDGLFKDFYNDLGGQERLGPVISHAFTYGQISYQYTQAALMAYDPLTKGRKRFYLAAIGLDMGVTQAAEPPLPGVNLQYVNGHYIEPSFWPLIQALGGLGRVGSPLTEARYNPVKGRIEQYFENLGFYRLEDDPSVHLLAYGLWRCGDSCPPPPAWPGEAEVVLPRAVGTEFSQTVARLGSHFVGFALSDPYPTPDGGMEQIFENVVLKMAPGQRGRASLLPLTRILGIEAAALAPPSSQPGLFFYPVQDNLGYNVPQEFLDYLSQHGGLDASGPPIGEALQINEEVIRQCFLNLCLEKHDQESGLLRIRPSPLGYSLWQKQSWEGVPQAGSPLSQASPPFSATQAAVVVQTWKRFPILGPGQQQEIGIIVLDNNQPVEGVRIDLILPMPDGSRRSLSLPPTGSDGQSTFTLEAPDVPAGTVLSYTLCAYYPRGQTTCVDDGFLTWR
jgi:hypothetical protein